MNKTSVVDIKSWLSCYVKYYVIVLEQYCYFLSCYFVHIIRTPAPVPFRTCICSYIETIFSWASHNFGLSFSNIPRYFYFARYWVQCARMQIKCRVHCLDRSDRYMLVILFNGKKVSPESERYRKCLFGYSRIVQRDICSFFLVFRLAPRMNVLFWGPGDFPVSF